MSENILSVGIDVGTSTTALVFSDIVIENTSGSARVPQYKILEKNIVYRSPMYFTPLVSNTELDVNQLMSIVKNEYSAAGYSFDDVSTGAVIITGDTARKKNASEVVSALSKYAGDFVVATAGPDMESIIAGKGSGADKYSYDNICTIANLDIGGGTTNVSVFKDGKLLDVACFDIGGRLIRFAKSTMKIEYIYPKIETLASSLGISASEGDILTESQVRTICDKMSDIVLEICSAQPKTSAYYDFVTNFKDFKSHTNIDVVSFSGGVGELIYNPVVDNPFAYDDVGVLLAEAIAKKVKQYGLNITKPAETIGATVVGAGSHSMDISGSTIFLSPEVAFPLKNLPVLKPVEDQLTSEALIDDIKNRIDWMRDADGTLTKSALCMKGKPDMSFNEIQEFADIIIKAMDSLMNEFGILIVVLENDFAKALGQSLRLKLPEKIKIVIIDSVKAEDGDYIDIGCPLGNGSVIPVIVKTLVFSY